MKKLSSLEWLNDRFSDCGCDKLYLRSYRKIAPKVAKLIRAADMTIVGSTHHQFHQGYTCVWLLKQSHLSLHSWPEYGFLTLNLEICNFKGDSDKKAEKLYGFLKALFQPRRYRPKKSRISLGN